MRIICLIFLSVVCTSAANLLENSSFEAGDLHGWSYGSGSFPIRTPFAVTKGNSYHGTKLMRLEQAPASNPNYIVSRAYRLKPSTQYTLSLYAKSDVGNSLVGALHFYPVNSDGRQGQLPGTYNVVQSSAAPIPTTWTRFAYTFTTHSDPLACVYNMHIFDHWQGANGGRTNEWISIDAVQLEEGSSATPYRPMNEVEVGANLRRDVPGHLFYTTDSISLDFTAFNNTFNPVTTPPITYEVRDLWDRLHLTGSFSFQVPASGSVTNPLVLTGLPLGYLRLTYCMPGYQGSLNDLQFAQMPPPVPLAHRTNSYFGGHLLNEPYFLAAAQRLGIHWNRHFSVEQVGSWIDIAPVSEHSIRTYTQSVALNRQFDIEPLINIGASEAMFRPGIRDTVPHIPDYATNSVDFWPKTNTWYSFATNVITTYKPYADYFEIFNEQANVRQYTNIMIWGHRAMRDAHPNGIIVGPAHFYAPVIDDLLKIVGDDKLDIWSTHLYAYGEAGDEFFYDYTRTRVDAHSKILFNTEAGLRTETASRANFWEDLFPATSGRYPDEGGITRDSRYRAQTMAHMFYYSMRPPMRAWFYYDGRTTHGYDKDITFSIFDFDTSVRPTALMFAAAAQRIENAEMKGRFSLDKRVDAYWWERAGIAGAVMWPTNMDEQLALPGGTGAGSYVMRKLKLVSTLNPSDFTAYDMFGNVLAYPPDGLPFGIDPIYVEAANGTSTSQFLASFSIVDGVDTEAPHLQIITYPLSGFTGDFVFRWNAVDDLNLDVRWNGRKGKPSYLVNTNAIQYRSALLPDEGAYGPWTNTSWRLLPGITWDSSKTFYVQVKDAVGNVRTASVAGIGTPASPLPGAPGGVTATPGIGSIMVSWLPVSGATSYTVKRGTALGGPYITLANSVTTLSFTDPLVALGTTYYYVLAANNGVGAGPDSMEVAAAPNPPLPGAPGSVTATASVGSIELAWSSATDAVTYVVRRSTSPAGSYINIAEDVNSLNYSDPAVTPGTLYYYVIAARNASGTGPDSLEVSGSAMAPTLDAPAGLSATAGIESIGIAWSAVQGAASYSVKRGATAGGPYSEVANVPGLGYTDSGLVPGFLYYYVVAASNSGGSGPNSVEVSSAPNPPVPGTPTGLAAAPGVNTISLSWNAVQHAATYILKRGIVPGGPYTVLANDLLTTSFSDKGLTPGVTYYYTVAAGNVSGTSLDSPEVPAQANPQPPILPAAPMGVAATPDSGNIILTWSEVPDATAYQIRRGLAPGGPYMFLAGNLTSTLYIDTMVVGGTTYYYVFSASNSAGTGPDSIEVSATAQQLGPTIPAAPAGVNVTASKATVVNPTATVRVVWDATAGATSYQVKRATAVSGPWTTVAASLSNNSFEEVRPASGATYYYIVTASNSAGTSQNSAVASIKPFGPAPTDLVASSPAAGKIQLQWTDRSADEDGFKIEVLMYNFWWIQVVKLPAESTSYTVNVTPGATYTYRVSASKGSFSTAYSASVTIKAQ